MSFLSGKYFQFVKFRKRIRSKDAFLMYLAPRSLIKKISPLLLAILIAILYKAAAVSVSIAVLIYP